MAFYVLDENNNKVEAYDKEGVLALLNQAIADGSLENIVADAAFVTKLKCCVDGGTFQIAFITQAKYNELATNKTLLENTYYFIVDDTTADGINEQLENILKAFEDPATLSTVKKASQALKVATELLNVDNTNRVTNVPISETGLYMCDIMFENHTPHYSILLSVEDLNNYHVAPFAVYLPSFSDNTLYEVGYEPINKTIYVGSGTPLTINSIRLITKY